MTHSKNLFCCFIIIECLQTIVTQYNYPAKKSSTRYSYTFYQSRKVENSIFTTKTYTEYKECVTSCYINKENCKSIDAEIIDNKTVICRFFNEEFPKTTLDDKFTYISSKPPNCSLSCNLTQNPCGKCKCNPSCATRNRRQHTCNCTLAAGIAKSCQEHYNNGFTKTAIFQINPNGFIFKTVCEMDKIEVKNIKVDHQMCMEQSLPMLQFSFALSISYCIINCANESNIDTVIFGFPCFCAKYVKEASLCNLTPCSKYDYCKINASSTSCTILKVSSNQNIIYDNKVSVFFNSSLCLSFCMIFHMKMPSYNGYVASGLVATNIDCLCLYGFTGNTVLGYYGCSYFETSTMAIVPGIKEDNEQVLQKSNLLATLSLLKKTFSLSFMLKPLLNDGDLRNILHLTNNNDFGYYGERIPAIWITSKSELYICFPVNGNINYDFKTQPLPYNVWSRVQISQTEVDEIYTYNIYLNDQLVHSNKNNDPRLFKNVKVYLSDPWHISFNGTIKDFRISNGYVNFVDENSERVIFKNSMVAKLSYLDESYLVFLKVKPKSFSPGWKCVLYLSTRNDLKQNGDKILTIFFNFDGLGSLRITSAVNGNDSYALYTKPLPLNEYSSIQISQTKSNGKCNFSVFLNDTIIHSVTNLWPQWFSNVKVYVSSPWYDAADGSVKELKIFSGRSGVWIPMMTRFSGWESTFWNKSFEFYENGFGLLNQQWIGLKKLNHITNNFFTDMRVDYSFKEEMKFSTIYYNVTIGSSDENYVFFYEKYNARGSGEPDRLNTNGMVFNSCSNWWTDKTQMNDNCDKDKFPTSPNFISYGSAEQLVSIQFFLQTNLEKK